MKLKYIKYFVLLAVMFLPLQSLAVDESTTTTTKDRGKRVQVLDDQKISQLKERGDREIARRITALNKLVTKINAIKKLTADEKSSFVSQINDYISQLNTLKAKIDADTDLATMKADIKSIIDDYRVFVLFMPKINILATADKITETTDNLTTLATKLQTRISEAEKNGQNVTTMKSELADMQAKIADAKTQAANAKAAVMTLEPSGYPGNRTGLETGRTDLQAARKDIVAAKEDARKIVQALKSTTSTPTTTQ